MVIMGFSCQSMKNIIEQLTGNGHIGGGAGIDVAFLEVMIPLVQGVVIHVTLKLFCFVLHIVCHLNAVLAHNVTVHVGCQKAQVVAQSGFGEGDAAPFLFMEKMCAVKHIGKIMGVLMSD